MDGEALSVGGDGPGRSFVRVGDLGPKDKLGLLRRVFGAAHDSVDPGERERVDLLAQGGATQLGVVLSALNLRAAIPPGSGRTILALAIPRTAAVRPTRSSVRALLQALAQGLDGASLKILRALALYPELRWPLTSHLATRLVSDGTPRDRIERAWLLARLPWLRSGTMPDWLRRALLAGMPGREQAAIVDTLHDLSARKSKSSAAASRFAYS